MEPSTRSAPVSTAQLARSLADIGLVSSAVFQAFVLTLSPAKRGDARQIMHELVRQGKLTRYQAMRVWQGKTANLVLGNYAVLDRVGQGGMGVVYKAQHRLMQRVVALKVLSSAVTRSPEAVARFQREAIATARLNHANIVTAFDAQEANGQHFLVMEFVEGQDLGQLTKAHGRLPIALAAECVRQAACGLSHAHENGIIHRDVKPGNLLLDQRGCVKVLDLGLVRFEEGLNAPGADGQLTQASVVFGTTDFMSPEQGANSRNTDPRSDLYALGCTLFYLATGQTMYQGETPLAKLIAHREDPIPSLRKACPDTSRVLESIYQRMVAKKPEDRYQTMAELLADLEPCVKALAGPERERAAQLTELLAAPGGAAQVNVSLAETQLGLEKSTLTSFRRLLPRRPVRGWLLAAGAALGCAIVVVLGLAFGLLGDAPPDAAATPPTAAKDAPAGDPWAQSVARLPAEQQLEQVIARLKEMNPGFDGPVESRLANGVVSELRFSTEAVSDLGPLRALTGVVKLECATVQGKRGKVTDLRPIAHLPLVSLSISRNPITDLTPLQKLPLQYLEMRGMQPADLTPLQKLPLTEISMPPPQVRRHVELLRTIPTLKKVNGQNAVDALK